MGVKVALVQVSEGIILLFTWSAAVNWSSPLRTMYLCALLYLRCLHLRVLSSCPFLARQTCLHGREYSLHYVHSLFDSAFV